MRLPSKINCIRSAEYCAIKSVKIFCEKLFHCFLLVIDIKRVLHQHKNNLLTTLKATQKQSTDKTSNTSTTVPASLSLKPIEREAGAKYSHEGYYYYILVSLLRPCSGIPATPLFWHNCYCCTDETSGITGFSNSLTS